VSELVVTNLYALIGELGRRTGGPPSLRDCSGRSNWPRRGVYFFFEPGEIRPDGTPRIVRVGTHALVTGSKSTLWTRLSQHKGHQSGTGNHRGSIFRLHVGAALIARGDIPAVPSWGQKSSAARAVRDTEVAIERAVSAYIGAMPFLWVAVDDEPGATSDRGVIEAGAITALSRISNPAADAPSADWLGNYAARPAIRESALWNVNHVAGPINDTFLTRLEQWVTRS
jgi:hypothetical protein